MSARARALAGLLALAACAASPAEPEDPPAQRADVAAALYRQLDLVIARYDEIADSPEPAAAAERTELATRARAIAMKIVRIDPKADVQTLAARVEHVR